MKFNLGNKAIKNSFWGSTLLLILGFIELFTPPSPENPVPQILGLSLLVGMAAYRSIKRRRLGLAPNTTTRIVFEGLTIAIQILLIVWAFFHPKTSFENPLAPMNPIWMITAYLFIYFAQTKIDADGKQSSISAHYPQWMPRSRWMPWIVMTVLVVLYLFGIPMVASLNPSLVSNEEGAQNMQQIKDYMQQIAYSSESGGNSSVDEREAMNQFSIVYKRFITEQNQLLNDLNNRIDVVMPTNPLSLENISDLTIIRSERAQIVQVQSLQRQSRAVWEGASARYLKYVSELNTSPEIKATLKSKWERSFTESRDKLNYQISLPERLVAALDKILAFLENNFDNYSTDGGQLVFSNPGAGYRPKHLQ